MIRKYSDDTKIAGVVDNKELFKTATGYRSDENLGRVDQWKLNKNYPFVRSQIGVEHIQ